MAHLTDIIGGAKPQPRKRSARPRFTASVPNENFRSREIAKLQLAVGGGFR
jgi:hypothetical protein